jgi:hypothetical protein
MSAEASAIDRLKEVIEAVFQDTQMQVEQLTVVWVNADAMGGPRRRLVKRIQVEFNKGY